MDWKRVKRKIGIMFSHHPDCGYFEEHILHIGKLRLCAGCTMFGLGVIASIFLFYPLTIIFGKNFLLFMFAGGFMMLFSFLIVVFKYRSIYNRIGKFLLGMGTLIYYVSGLATFLAYLVAISFPIGIVIYAFYSRKKHKEICSKCEKCTFEI